MEKDEDLEYKEGVDLFDKHTPILKATDSCNEVIQPRQNTHEESNNYVE